VVEEKPVEMMRSIMENYDFEDLEDKKSEIVVAEEPEIVAKPVEQVVESSDEECVVKGDVPCWKCNGLQRNKRGRPCKKCDGTGLIQS